MNTIYMGIDFCRKLLNIDWKKFKNKKMMLINYIKKLNFDEILV